MPIHKKTFQTINVTVVQVQYNQRASGNKVTLPLFFFSLVFVFLLSSSDWLFWPGQASFLLHGFILWFEATFTFCPLQHQHYHHQCHCLQPNNTDNIPSFLPDKCVNFFQRKIETHRVICKLFFYTKVLNNWQLLTGETCIVHICLCVKLCCRRHLSWLFLTGETSYYTLLNKCLILPNILPPFVQKRRER